MNLGGTVLFSGRVQGPHSLIFWFSADIRQLMIGLSMNIHVEPDHDITMGDVEIPIVFILKFL